MTKGVQSARTTLTVIEEVGRKQPVGVSELARSLGLPKTTVQRSLVTLCDAGWLICDDGSQWSLSAKVADLGRLASGNRLREAALPVMRRLREETAETINLMAVEGDVVRLVETLDSSLPVRIVSRIGSHAPLHASGNGKAVLALLPDEAVESYIRRGLARHTPRTITDGQALAKELRAIRRRGYAVNRGEYEPDVASVAAAVVGATAPVGSVSVSLPAHRLNDGVIPELGRLVSGAAAEIGAALGRD